MSSSPSPDGQPTVTIQRVLPHQWPDLEPIFRAEGHSLPLWSGMPAFVAVSEGKVVGLLAMVPMPQLELWVDEAFRGRGIARELCEEAKDEMMEEIPFVALARNQATVSLCTEFAMQEQLGITVFMMPELRPMGGG